MALVQVNTRVLTQLSVLLLSCLITVFGDEVDTLAPPPYQWHHHQSPAYPPSEAPEHHWLHPPYHPPLPAHPPIHPPEPGHPFTGRRFIAVQGVVYCKSCKYYGIDTLLAARPLPGAVVKLECNSSKHSLVQEALTDKNGFFFLEAPKRISSFGAHKCKVFLVSSPFPTCSKPTNLNHGQDGAALRPPLPPSIFHPLPHPPPPPYELFTVGPFAFEPFFKCPH
ncbi:hypothetical protein U1Q18_010676 [Sarracenia purpurea var. burkii]